MEKDRYIDIKIYKYDTIFDRWLEETGSYIDQNCFYRIQKKFDDSMGLLNCEYLPSNDNKLIEDSYRFKMIDGKKFMLAILKYDLYDDGMN